MNGIVSLGPHFRVEAQSELSFLKFEEEWSEQLTVNGKVVISPNNRINLDLIFQVNTVAEQAVGLARLRWRYLPGSDLFFVYREIINYGDLSSSRTATLKLNYWFDVIL